MFEGAAAGVLSKANLHWHLFHRDVSFQQGWALEGERGSDRERHADGGCQMQRILALGNADGSLHVYVVLYKPEAWIVLHRSSKREAGMRDIAGGLKDGLLIYRALVTESEIDPVVWPIYALPNEHRWEGVLGVTLLGDAAHLMSPFAGKGANLAMYDGWEWRQRSYIGRGQVKDEAWAKLAGWRSYFRS